MASYHIIMKRKTVNVTYSISPKDVEKLKKIQQIEGIHSQSETIRRIIDHEFQRLISNEVKAG